MSLPIVDRTRIPLLKLAWPILVENILRTSLMSVDTFMLSRYSQNAVAAMSLVNQFAFFIQLLYMMTSIGARRVSWASGAFPSSSPCPWAGRPPAHRWDLPCALSLFPAIVPAWRQ